MFYKFKVHNEDNEVGIIKLSKNNTVADLRKAVLSVLPTWNSNTRFLLKLRSQNNSRWTTIIENWNQYTLDNSPFVQCRDKQPISISVVKMERGGNRKTRSKRQNKRGQTLRIR
jgi:hypothetical protein